jgi:glycosyltransferase involved in cell wall biosynthesis
MHTPSPRPLTVLQLTHQGDGAGSTQSIYSLSVHLARRGHRVLVGCRPDTLLARLLRGGAPGVRHVPFEFTDVRGAARTLADLVARERVDVVNSHATQDRRACTWLRWRHALPQALVVTRRTMPRTLPPALIAVGLTADRTIAVSGAVARGLRRLLHPPRRLRVVPNGIDLERVSAPPAPADLAAARAALGEVGDRALIVVVARRKDQEVPIRALTLLERPVVLACVGLEPDAALARAAGDVPPRHRVVFVPFTHRPLAFYHLAAVSALPSRIEGLSQALLEAMVLQRPVVASDAGGNTDLITSGVTGVLVPPRDPVAWSRAFASLLADSEYAARLARAGAELVRREYALPLTAARTAAVYEEAVARRRLLRGEAHG